MIVKVKFSKSPVFDQEYMESQREYTFKTNVEIKEGYILFANMYKKFLHVIETIIDVDSEYYTPSIDKFTKTAFDDNSFKLKELIETKEWYDFKDITQIDKPGYCITSFPIFDVI